MTRFLEAARQHRWEFLLTVAAVPVLGGTGFPINPIATFQCWAWTKELAAACYGCGTGGFTLAAGRVPLRIQRWIRRPLPASPVYMRFFESNMELTGIGLKAA